MNKNKTNVEKKETMLPEGIFCGGYCKNCSNSEPYNDGWYYCNYHKKSVQPLDWHECYE